MFTRNPIKAKIIFSSNYIHVFSGDIVIIAMSYYAENST